MKTNNQLYSSAKYTCSQLAVLIFLRLSIGWHFLYEGLSKLFIPNWSASAYLLDSGAPFSFVFHWVAHTPVLLECVDNLNITALILVGITLITGAFVKWSCIAGMFLLFIYYLSHIPYVGAEYLSPTEGNYLWIDKNIIEFFALGVVLIFPTSHIIGIDRLTKLLWKKKTKIN